MLKHLIKKITDNGLVIKFNRNEIDDSVIRIEVMDPNTRQVEGVEIKWSEIFSLSPSREEEQANKVFDVIREDFKLILWKS